MDLFEHHKNSVIKKNAPLADRMRPRTLDEFIGQEHILGPGRLLRRAITIDQISSIIFYGPPGTGKTTLARIIANTTKAQFLSINAVLAGVKDIREAIDAAGQSLSLYGRRTILFIDEVHRFNKAQQDALLPHVENGVVIMIGATTENPYFEVNRALVSRSRIFQLKSLSLADLRAIARQALADKERGFGNKNVQITDEALDHLVTVANGDARGVLNALELAIETTPAAADGMIRVDRAIAEDSIQQRAVLYDKDGDAHYDTISAFIKSVRGSDPDAALYWMAKMVYAGEEPRFIFRRMLILACEDVGLADPAALGVVMDASRAFDYVGLPEGRYHLAHACLYLATAPKSNSSMAFFDALASLAKETSDDVPNHLRDASRDKEGFGHGDGYLYPHAYRDHWTAQQYLPDALQGKLFYQPSDQGYEKTIQARVQRMREAQLEAMARAEDADGLSQMSTTPDGSGERLWARRTMQNAGEMLADIRDTIFDRAGITRESLVADLNAGTGLLTFEALRRAPEGDVWAIAHDTGAGETLIKMAVNYQSLRQPHCLASSWQTLADDIKKEAGANVAFDVIVGRNILSRADDRTGRLALIASLLSSSGAAVLAEVVPSRGPRLSPLLTVSGAEQPLHSALAQAQEALFNDPDNLLVNWNPEDLAQQASARTGLRVACNCKTYGLIRRFTKEEIVRWFRHAPAGAPRSLGDYLRKTLPEAGCDAVRDLLIRQLPNRDCKWTETVAFFRISKTQT